MANARALADTGGGNAGLARDGPRHAADGVRRATSRPGLAGEALDAHTRAWAEAVNRSGVAYLTPAVVDGRWMVRVSVGALATEAADIETAWQAIRVAAETGGL